MEAVNQMLRLRETHQSQTRSDGRMIDLLVFPELAVHPSRYRHIHFAFYSNAQVYGTFRTGVSSSEFLARCTADQQLSLDDSGMEC